jgi:hypothetical protein
MTAARLRSARLSVRRHVVYDHIAGDPGVDNRKPAGNLVTDGGAGEPTGTGGSVAVMIVDQDGDALQRMAQHLVIGADQR